MPFFVSPCRTASLVLLATLAIPIQPTHSERQVSIQLDYTKQEKMRRLSSLLKLSTPPTRASLIKDLVSQSVHLGRCELNKLRRVGS